VHVKAGETLLYRACDLNDADLVRRLLDKGAALNPPVGKVDVGPSIWCRQDSELNTILHRAVLKKYDIEIIDVILKADPSVTKVKDRSNRLPVEVFLHSKGDNDELLFEDLPLALVCKLFGMMKPADLELVIASL
jgi:ankyrin repeat protein